MKKKFNVVDAVLVLLLVAAVAVCLLFLRQRGTIASQTETSPMRFTLELREVQPETMALFETGQSIYRSTDGVYLGVLADYYSEPYTKTEYSQLLEKYVTYECEDLYRVYLVIEGQGYETAADVVISDVTVKIGDEVFVKSKGYAGAGFITGIDTMGAPAVENTAVGLGDTAVTYSIRISGVRDFTADAFSVGDRVYDKSTGALLGVVKDIEIVPDFAYEMGADGKGVTVEKDGRWRVFLTLEARCTETDNSYFLDGKNELKVGAELVMATKYVKCEMRYHELLQVA